ncbi:hypothetical protein BCh11DRAFT_02916 [Burkholderia sp. Ch1-1]|jgi:hypothetical protein|nr:hypothetical protein BCh11DRAFT_02916 [Burkholderia sp. Ch1-1]
MLSGAPLTARRSAALYSLNEYETDHAELLVARLTQAARFHSTIET